MLAYIIFFQYFLSYKMGMFPISGYDAGFDSRWQYLVLPIVIWVIVSIGSEVLLYRTVIVDEIFNDYVRTARAKGLTEKVVLFKHVLKNAMIPIITNIVLEIPFLYTGSLLLENFFGIPGLGGMTVQALNNADFPVIKAMTYIGSVLYVVFNLLSDVAYAVVDPRIKLE
jgi:peptide/nickel transport system permease protein